MDFLIVLAVLLVVVLVVSAPLRREAVARSTRTDEVAELEAARDAKYREIRDAELDFATGKLSQADYEAVDQGLRTEAIEILGQIDRAQDRAGATIGER